MNQPRVIATAIMAVALSSTARGASIVHLDDIGFDFNSKYVSRGAIVADQPALQPTASLSMPGTPFAIDAWGSFVPSDRSAMRACDELDLTASAGFEQKLGSQLFDLSVGVARYNYPGADAGERATHEIVCECAHQSTFAPALSYYYDFDQLDASYLKASCSRDLALNESGTLSVCVCPSLAFGDLDQAFGFQDATLALSMGIELGSISISPSFGYSEASAAQNSDRRGVWTGVGIHFAAE